MAKLKEQKELPENTELQEEEETEMTFLEHLEELRWRIVYIVIGLVVGAIICGVFIDYLVEDVLLAPATKSGAQLQNLKPFGQFFLYFQVAIIGGFIISVPNFFYQLWKFIAPALRSNEKKYVFSIALYSSICFLAGIAFAYFVMLPLTLKFAAQFGTELIKNEFALDEYMSIIFSVMLAAGLVFELPMLSFFLSRIGIVTPQFMAKYRRHAVVFLMIAAAVLTPGTDPLAQVILAVPLFLLYEISILVSKTAAKKRE